MPRRAPRPLCWRCCAGSSTREEPSIDDVETEDVEDIKAKTDALNQAFHKVSQAMYERAQAEQAAQRLCLVADRAAVPAVEVVSDPVPLAWTRAPLRRPPRCRRPVDRLPADLQHTHHGRQSEAPSDQLARPGDAHPHSQPRNASPAISSSYVFLPSARSS